MFWLQQLMAPAFTGIHGVRWVRCRWLRAVQCCGDLNSFRRPALCLDIRWHQIRSLRISVAHRRKSFRDNWRERACACAMVCKFCLDEGCKNGLCTVRILALHFPEVVKKGRWGVALPRCTSELFIPCLSSPSCTTLLQRSCRTTRCARIQPPPAPSGPRSTPFSLWESCGCTSGSSSCEFSRAS